jgi:hypothetical protein
MGEDHGLPHSQKPKRRRKNAIEGEERTLTLPMRLAMEDATNMDAAEIRLVVKKIEPSSPSGRENLRLKKYVIQDL